MTLLRAYGVELILAVTPDVAHGLGAAIRVAEQYGVRVSVWPMLSREEGRWLNATTATPFIEFVRQIYDKSRRETWPLVEVLFDLEPTFGEVIAAVNRPVAAWNFIKSLDEKRERVQRVEYEFGALCSMLAGEGVALASAVVPMAATARDPDTWRALLGIPREPSGATQCAMLYTSLLEGWSRGAVSRADAMGLLRCGADASLARWGAEAEVAVGLVGTGIFGNEPRYRSPLELAADVAVVRGAGAKAIALFDLGGVLAREPAEAWLEALFVTDQVPIEPTWRARAMWGALERLPEAVTLFRRRA
jgi:hypothetical protein